MVVITPTPPISSLPIVSAPTSASVSAPATASPPIAPMTAPMTPRQAARSAAVVFGFLVVAIVPTIVSSYSYSTTTSIVGIPPTGSLPIGLAALAAASVASPILVVVIHVIAVVVISAAVSIVIAIAPPTVHTTRLASTSRYQ